MSVLFGHPTGNPNSFQAALAHFEAGRLESLCIPWMPSQTTLKILRKIPGLASLSDRLARRHFKKLIKAPKIQDRFGEWKRLILRASGKGNEGLSYEANDWLMLTMAREVHRPGVKVVHSYEDCSFLQFEKAKRLGKACIYDMPIGYYPAWQDTQTMLARQYDEWLPVGGLPSNRWVRAEQKRKELWLADLVLVPSRFVAETITEHCTGKKVTIAPYGVNSTFWTPQSGGRAQAPLTFIFAGQCSLRKGIPLLLDAWRMAELPDARLQLIGAWQLAAGRQNNLPSNATWAPPQPQMELRKLFQAADVFVLPTFFEGRALVVGEALASGLPVLTTPASGADDLIDDFSGRLFPTGDRDALIEKLRWFSDHRGDLSAMSRAARYVAEKCTWKNYRHCVIDAVTSYI